MQRKVAPELDFTSDKFDPKKFLYSSNIHLPYPKAKVYDNVSDWHNHTFGKKKSDNLQNSHKKASKNEHETLKRNFKWYYGTLGLNIPRNFNEEKQYLKSFKRRRDQYGRIKKVNVKVVAPETLQPLRSSKVTIIRTNNITSDNYFLKNEDATSKKPVNKLNFEHISPQNKMAKNNIEKNPENCCLACAEIEALCSMESSENNLLDQSKYSVNPNSVTEIKNLDLHSNDGLCKNNDEYINNEMCDSRQTLLGTESKFGGAVHIPEIKCNKKNGQTPFCSHDENQVVKKSCETNSSVEEKTDNFSVRSKSSSLSMSTNSINILNDIFKRTFKNKDGKHPAILKKGFNSDVSCKIDTELHDNKHKASENNINNASELKLDKAEPEVVSNTTSVQILQDICSEMLSKVNMSSNSPVNVADNKYFEENDNQQQKNEIISKISSSSKTEFENVPENAKAAAILASDSSVMPTNLNDFKTFQSSKALHNSEIIDVQKTTLKSNKSKQSAISNTGDFKSDVIYKIKAGSNENRNKVTKTKIYDATKEKSCKDKCDTRSYTASEQIMLDMNGLERKSEVNMTSNSLVTVINNTDSNEKTNQNKGNKKSNKVESISKSGNKKADRISTSSDSFMKGTLEDSRTNSKNSIPIQSANLNSVKTSSNTKKLQDSKTTDTVERTLKHNVVKQPLMFSSSMFHKRDITLCKANNEDPEKIVCSVSEEKHSILQYEAGNNTASERTIQDAHGVLTPSEVNFSSDSFSTVCDKDNAQVNNWQKRNKKSNKIESSSLSNEKSERKNNWPTETRKSKKVKSSKSVYESKKARISDSSCIKSPLEDNSIKANVELSSNAFQCLKKSHISKRDDILERTLKCNEVKRPKTSETEFNFDVDHKINVEPLAKGSKVADPNLSNTASEQIIVNTHESPEAHITPNSSLTFLSSKEYKGKTRKSNKAETHSNSVYENKKTRISALSDLSIKSNLKDSSFSCRNSALVTSMKSNNLKNSTVQKSCNVERGTGSSTASEQNLQDIHCLIKPPEVNMNSSPSATVVGSKESVKKKHQQKGSKKINKVESNSKTVHKNLSDVAIPTFSDSVKSVDDFVSKLKLKRKSPINENKRISKRNSPDASIKTDGPESTGKKRYAVEDILPNRKIPKTESWDYFDASPKLDDNCAQRSKSCDKLQTNRQLNASDSPDNAFNIKEKMLNEDIIKNRKETPSPEICTNSNSSGSFSAANSCASFKIQEKNDNGSVKICATPKIPNDLESKEKALLELARSARKKVSGQSPQ